MHIFFHSYLSFPLLLFLSLTLSISLSLTYSLSLSHYLFLFHTCHILSRCQNVDSFSYIILVQAVWRTGSGGRTWRKRRRLTTTKPNFLPRPTLSSYNRLTSRRFCVRPARNTCGRPARNTWKTNRERKKKQPGTSL